MTDERPSPPSRSSSPPSPEHQPGHPPGFGQSRYQLDPDDTPTLPNLFAQGNPPPGFWDTPRPPDDASRAPAGGGAATGAGPGTGSGGEPQPPRAIPRVVPAATGDEQLGVQVASTLPPRSERRRGALIAVGLVALATVIVVAAALLIGPHLGSGQADDDRQVVPPVIPTSATSTTGGTTTPTTSTGPILPPVDPASRTGAAGSSGSDAGSSAASAPATGSAAASPSVVTVTVTAGSTTTGTDGSTRGGPRTGTTGATSSSAAAKTSSSTATSKTTTTSSQPSRYGVPIRQIGCGDGYIVQLASELSADAFAQRVADLKRQGLVPADAKAANSRKSCRLFTDQTNTYILYSGPFRHRYDACSDRLSGPYDALIRGARPDTSREFVSCICPVGAGSLPTISRVGTTGQWIGELQHMLATHLRYSIPDLGVNSWGVYTPDTRAAVRRFQSDHRMPATGTVDARTWKALQRAGC